MKINDVIEEGFWGSLAKGIGAEHTANSLDAAEQAQTRRQNVRKQLATNKANIQNAAPAPAVNYDIPPSKRGYVSPRTVAPQQPAPTTVPMNTQLGNKPPKPVNYDIPPGKRGYVSPRKPAPVVTAPPTVEPTPVATQPAVAPAAKAKIATAKAAAMPVKATMGKKGEPVDFSKLSPAAKAQLRAQGVAVPESKENIMKNKQEIVKEMALRRTHKEKQLQESLPRIETGKEQDYLVTYDCLIKDNPESRGTGSLIVSASDLHHANKLARATLRRDERIKSFKINNISPKLDRE